MNKHIFMAVGIAAATSVAAPLAHACAEHMSMMPSGLQVSHPDSVSVSLATRQAIDSESIRDIPRFSRHDKFVALQRIGRRFHSMTESADIVMPDKQVAFMVYLTESNRWKRFTYADEQWSVDAYQPVDDQQEVVMVLSDTALMNLLDKSLKLEEARALGVVVLSGNEEGQQQVIDTFDRFLAAYEV